MDFLADLVRTVEAAATRAAEAVVARDAAAITDLRRRTNALLADAELAAARVRAAASFVESAQKAGAVPFIGAAERTDFGIAETMGDGGLPQEFHVGPWRVEGRVSVPEGRYTVVVSLYRQGST